MVLPLIELAVLSVVAPLFRREFGGLMLSAWVAPFLGMAASVALLLWTPLGPGLLRLLVGVAAYMAIATPWRLIVGRQGALRSLRR